MNLLQPEVVSKVLRVISVLMIFISFVSTPSSLGNAATSTQLADIIKSDINSISELDENIIEDVITDKNDIRFEPDALAFANLKDESTPDRSHLINNNRIETFTIKMPQLDGRERTIIVYLPSDYESGDTSYPVIYLQDAQNVFSRYGASSEDLFLNEALYEFYTNGIKGKVIAVGIEFDRYHIWDEYSPWVNDNMYAWADHHYANRTEGGEGDAYLDFLVQTLKPEIDHHYRTLSDRENTAIAGSNMGGLISLYAGLTRPDVYSKVMAMSTSVWFAESGGAWLTNNQLIELINNMSVPQNVAFSFDVGTEERSTDLETRPDVHDPKGVPISFSQAYLEGTQAVVKALVHGGLPLMNIKGGPENPSEWTEGIVEPFDWLSREGLFFSYFPLIFRPKIPPQITSAATATFTINHSGEFAIQATGNPTPAISYTGTLPVGVTLLDNVNGTATLSGKPVGTYGVYQLTITADNGATPAATQAFTMRVVEGCPNSNSCIIAFNIYMGTALNRWRKIWVYLPPNYNTSGLSYRVIYVLDAQDLFDPMTQTLNTLYKNTSKGMIAVGIEYDNDYAWSEFSPWVNHYMYDWVWPEDAKAEEGGEGDEFINFIRYTLKPTIDGKYRTYRDRLYTAILGGSRTGHLAIVAGLIAPETFSKVMAMGSAVWLAEDGGYWLSNNRLLAWINKTTNTVPKNVAFYLYVGKKEVSTGGGYPLVYLPDGKKITYPYAYLDGTRAVYDALRNRGISLSNIIKVENPEGTHDPNIWAQYFDDALRWFGFY